MTTTLPTGNEARKVIGQRIRTLRKDRGLSMLALAQSLGKRSAAYIAFIETGDRNMTAAELARVATVFRVKLSYFYP